MSVPREKKSHPSFVNISPTVVIMPPPSSVMGEVYCFPRRQLIVSFGSCVICHFKGLRVATFQNRFCLTVPQSSNE